MRKMFVVLLCCVSVLYAQCPKDWVESESIYRILSQAEEEASLPIGLAHCVAYTESRFKPTAMSRVVDGYRSCGIMQLYRKHIVDAADTFYDGGYKTFNWKDPEDNAQVGCRYLAYLIKKFDGSVYLGVLSYNMGETSLRNIHELSDIPEPCKRYADKIMYLLDHYDASWR